MKKFLLILAFLFATASSFAHVYEIRVNQAQDGSLTWYLITYHGVNQCGHANAGLTINGVNYPIDAEFAGDGALLSPNVFATIGFAFSHASYATVHTPFLGTNISVAPYSNNVCWAFAVGGSGNFTPPPPPVCTTCPITGWSNVVSTSGNNKGTFCNAADDNTTSTIKVNHLSCASITGSKQFSVIFDPGGANVPYGPFNYTSGGVETDVTINIPYGTSNSTMVNVVDASFPCNVTHGLSIPGGQYLGEKETVPPSITCPGPQTVCLNTLPDYRSNAVVSDNCTPSNDITVTQSPAAGSTVSGVVMVTLTATDAAGNQSTCSFTVTTGDTQKPTITCPANQTLNLDPSCNASLPDYRSLVTVSDNCTETRSLVVTQSPAAGTIISSKGAMTIVFTVSDAAGNTNTCSITVDKKDVTPPVQPELADITGECSATVTVIPTATDNCTGTVTGTTSDALTYTTQGTHTITWSFDDGNGNISTATQNVVIKDVTPPTVKTQPVTVTLDAAGNASVLASQVNAGSFDNCGVQSVSVSPSEFHCANIGANTVTLTVKDVNGLTNTGLAVVTVVGAIPGCSIKSVPTSNVYTGGNANNLYLGYGAQSTMLQVTPSAVSGNGGPAYTYTYSWSGNVGLLSSTTSGTPVFTPTASGSYTFIVTTTNNYGCTTTCTITICVSDIRVPGTNGSKVYVCHVPPGNTGNPQTLSISVNAVPAHLGNHAGDRLGSCDMAPCSGSAPIVKNSTNSALSVVTKENTEVSAEELKITVMPNPSSSYFSIKLESKFATPVSLKVMDATGRVVDVKSNINANSTIQIGHSYFSGTYYAEMIQGTQRKVVQLMKTR